MTSSWIRLANSISPSPIRFLNTSSTSPSPTISIPEPPAGHRPIQPQPGSIHSGASKHGSGPYSHPRSCPAPLLHHRSRPTARNGPSRPPAPPAPPPLHPHGRPSYLALTFERAFESPIPFLDAWIARARATGIRQLLQMANTLSIHRQGLLAHYDVPISTGPLEGINNKIKTLQRQAYGFRDQVFFRLRIYALHETRYALIG
ncbi:MAG TPA: transposase [Longimicrobiales bacterium]|nr:transposase [Longimicrobiales bacterium]